jgi:hypothetical protein
LAWTPRPERVRSRLLARDREDARSKLKLFGAVTIPEVIDKETIASYMGDRTQAILPELKLFIAPSPVKCGCPYCASLVNPFSGTLSQEARKVYEMVDGLLRLKGSTATSDASVTNDVETTPGGNPLMSKLNAVCFNTTLTRRQPSCPTSGVGQLGIASSIPTRTSVSSQMPFLPSQS